MLHPRRKRFRSHSVNSQIPNMLTVVGLCFGLTSIRFALQDRWELAVASIIAAGIIDGLDGRIARILKASTEFGAHLDSLCDFVCFGVAPAAVLYLWTLHVGGGAGWGVVLLFSVCMALRLARYNVSQADPDRPAWAAKYFLGVPAPAASGIAMLPMILTFVFEIDIFREPILVGIHSVGVALLMVSRIPMFSGQGFRKVRQEHVLPLLLLVGVMIAVMIGYPWHAFAILGFGYLGSIPFSMFSYRRRTGEWYAKRATEAKKDAKPPGDGARAEDDESPNESARRVKKRAAGLSVYESGSGWSPVKKPDGGPADKNE